MLNADDYMPKTIYDIVYQSDRSRECIEEIVERQVPFPSGGVNGIILWGVWGTGKTALAKILPNAIEQRLSGKDALPEIIAVMPNGSGIATIKQIEAIAKTNSYFYSDYHYFVLDEVDLLGKEGMEALKAVMNRPRTIFIMTTNNISKVDPGVKSRSVLVEFNKAPSSAWLPLVRRIMNDAGVTIRDEEAILTYIEHCDGSAREVLKRTFQFIRKYKNQITV